MKLKNKMEIFKVCYLEHWVHLYWVIYYLEKDYAELVKDCIEQVLN